MKKVYVETYGCTSNKSDSQTMIGLLQQAGYKITSDEKEADYLLVNTCGVKSRTEEKIISRLHDLAELDKKLIVSGCLTKINPERIKKTVPNFAGMLDARSVHKIVDVVEQIEDGIENIIQISDKPADKPSLPRFSFSKVIDIVKLSDGCLSNCSFCATKLSRGNLYSYRPDAVRDAIKRGLREGYKEFHLTSEDSSAYGRDIGTNLAELLESITRIDGRFFVRVGMMNPLHFKKVEIKDLINAYKSEKVFKFLHLCVQSGSNKILKIMNRGYTAEDFVYYIEQFREEIPELTLWTDIIVGHPGETEEDFQQGMELIRKIKPDFVNVSAYTVRPSTRAAKMKQIPTEIKKERTRAMSALVEEVSLERNKRWLGWQGAVLIDEYNEQKENFIGRNYAYKPVAVKGDFKLGDIIQTCVISAEKTCLIGI